MTTAPGRLPRERNASQSEPAHFLRLALRPENRDAELVVEQRLFSVAERRGVMRLIASSDGRRASLRLHEDAAVHSTVLLDGQHIVHELAPGRCAWVHVVSGEITLDDYCLTTGDGIGVSGQPAVSFTARTDTEVLLVDLPLTAGMVGDAGAMQ